MISDKGLALIKEFEGCVLHAYRDAVGVVTIGYGTTNADYSITKTKIYMGMTITKAQAEEWLRASVNNKYVPLVMKYDNIYHWNQNQLDALTSFCYNIGSIDQLTASGTRSISTISERILAYNRAGGAVLEGLTRRRKAEKTLFDTACDYKAEEDSYSLPVIKSGSKGKAVAVWQIIADAKPDGYFGAETVKATEIFQKDNGLTVDGIVGAKTWAKGLSSL